MKLSTTRLLAGILLGAVALAAPLQTVAQPYPSQNPTYIPTATLAAQTFTDTGTYVFITNGIGSVNTRVVKGGSATYTGAIQCTSDGTNWSTLQAIPVGGGAVVTSMSTSGFWTVNSSGCTRVRFNITAEGGTGGLTVQMSGSQAASAVYTLPSVDTGTAYTLLSAATTNSNSVKGSAGTLYSVNALNTNAATAYLKFYNVAAAPTCASDTILLTYTLVQNVPLSVSLPTGATFGTGIGICITAAAAANDNAAATTGITLSATYK